MKLLHPNILTEAERFAAQNPDIMVSVASPDGIYIYISPAHTRILGYSREEMIGRTYQQFAVSIENFNNIHLTDIDLTNDPVQMEFTLQAKSGIHVHIVTIARAILDPDTGESFILAKSKVLPG